MARSIARRLVLHALWGVPALAVAFLVFLWFEAGGDVRYMMRVLVHRDSRTSDYRWKRSMPVAKSDTPVVWAERPDCAGVGKAFAAETGIPSMEHYLDEGGALGFVVVRDGAIACEWYGNGGGRADPAAAFSVSKTVVALLLARAVADGKLGSLDEPITRHVPALAERDSRFAAITIANLLDMRSGIAFQEYATFPWVNQDAPAVYYASDLAKTVVARPKIEAAPGPFVYNDVAPNLNGLVLQRVYGQRLATGPMQALWSAIGAEYPAAWSVDDEGFAWHESGFVVTARDLARVGQLMLTDGRVGDRQVAPAAFLARSFDPVGRVTAATFGDTKLGYRNGWWVLDDGTLAAMGRYGQIVVVSPATHVVIARLGEDGHDETNVSMVLRFRRVAQRLAR